MRDLSQRITTALQVEKNKSPGFSVSAMPCRRKVKTTLYFKVPPTHYMTKTKTQTAVKLFSVN